MDNTIGDRFKIIMEKEALNWTELGDLMGCSDTNAKKIVRGESSPGYEIIYRVLQTKDWISSDWLLLGKGNIKKEYIEDRLLALEEEVKRIKGEKNQIPTSKLSDAEIEAIKQKNKDLNKLLNISKQKNKPNSDQ